MPQIITKPFGELTTLEYNRIIQAREVVFFLEQHITEPEVDDVDTRSVFMWMEEGGQVIAFLRIIAPGIVYDESSIGRVMVAAGHRRRGLCRRLMLEALHYIETHWGRQPVRISAQEYLAGFYGSLGFEVVSEIYAEAGIPHLKMLRP